MIEVQGGGGGSQAIGDERLQKQAGRRVNPDSDCDTFRGDV